MDPDLIICPVDNSMATPTPEDLKEDDDLQVDGFQILLPQVVR